MTPNPASLYIALEFGRSYHAVRIAINRLVAVGWRRVRAEQYVREVLSVGNDLDDAVRVVWREEGREVTW